MISRRLMILCASLLGLGLGLIALEPACSSAEANNAIASLRVGMVQTFFHDVPRPLIEFVTDPFGDVMKEATGLTGQLQVGGTPLDVAKNLNDGTLHLGVFHGHEFAWAQQKYSDLRPLMVAVNAQHKFQSYVITRKDGEAGSFADLKGKTLSVPLRTKEPCQVFLKRSCQEAGACAPKAYFTKIVASANVETALDAVLGGKVDACVIDNLGLEFYRDLKPGCLARLKVLKESELFPAAVIAYRQGSLDDATTARLKAGLVNAHNLETGREMMKLWKIHSFEPIPDGFAAQLAETLKAYPLPEAAAKVSLR